jgi:tRNA(Ile)-lysidine synthase
MVSAVNDLPHRLNQVIARHRLITDGESALIAVSGGVDSMVLLHALAELAPTHRWKLTVAHFNHQLRGRDSDADERFVARAAKKLNLRFVSNRGDVKAFAAAQKLSIEMAARTLRHRFLAHTAERLGVCRAFLAHHADDQVELFFLRLLRGAGTQGLGGMEWSAVSSASRSLKLLRPLLNETKVALLDFARTRKIKFREDATNYSPDILRNRMRQKLLPRLRRDFAPALDRAVLRSMELVRDEGDFVTFEAAAWLRRKRRAAFGALHVALQRRVIQLSLIGHGVVPQFDHVEYLRTHVNKWLTVHASFVGRRRADGEIEMRPVLAARFHSGEARVALGTRAGQTACESAVLMWNFLRGHALPPPSAHTEFFDADTVGRSLVLRHWREGDRFQPIGMKRAVKLQDFFTNQKIPRARRHELLLGVTQHGEIFWVEGARIGERFKITPATRRILKWSWQRS